MKNLQDVSSHSQSGLLDLEVDLVLQTAYRVYGYDFKLYSRDSVVRQVVDIKKSLQLKNVSQMIPLMIHEPNLRERFLEKMSIGVTAFFRDPEFYTSYRNNVCPHLSTFPYIKIWHAGCSTGNESYSNAILLHEEDLLERAVIYATDFNQHSLKKAREAIYSREALSVGEKNYQAFAGRYTFNRYFTNFYEHGKLVNFLTQMVTLSHHNLAQDGVFGEMNVIFCRNVLIYFNQQLQNQVLDLFFDSLRPGGFLCLGKHESLIFSDKKSKFDIVDSEQKIYRKKIL